MPWLLGSVGAPEQMIHELPWRTFPTGSTFAKSGLAQFWVNNAGGGTGGTLKCSQTVLNAAGECFEELNICCSWEKKICGRI